MKGSDFRLRMDFRALLATHLRMIHARAVNQQHKAEKGNGTKDLKARTSELIYAAHLHEC